MSAGPASPSTGMEVGVRLSTDTEVFSAVRAAAEDIGDTPADKAAHVCVGCVGLTVSSMTMPRRALITTSSGVRNLGAAASKQFRNFDPS